MHTTRPPTERTAKTHRTRTQNPLPAKSAGERLGIKRKAYELDCANIALEGLCAGGKRCRLEDITRGKVAVIDFWVTRGRGATSIATMDA